VSDDESDARLVDKEVPPDGDEQQANVQNHESETLAHLEEPANADDRVLDLVIIVRIFHQQNFHWQTYSADNGHLSFKKREHLN